MKRLDEAKLLEQLVSPSQVRRVEAQWELLKRGSSPGLSATLMNVAMSSSYPLEGRVAALFTLTQLEGENGHLAMATARFDAGDARVCTAGDGGPRGSALRCEGRNCSSPRCRFQSARARAGGDGDRTSWQKRSRGGTCAADGGRRPARPPRGHAVIATFERRRRVHRGAEGLSKPQVVAGAMRTLREFHDANVVTAVAEVLEKAPTPALRRDAIRTLAKLYHVEGKWDGKFWWTPRPDTRGPYYTHVTWAQSSRVATLLMNAIGDRDEPTAKLALFYIGNIECKEATTTLARMVSGGGLLRDDAAKALIAVKPQSPEALAAMERVVLGDNFDPAVRTSAATALASVEPAAGAPVLIRVLTKLDTAPKVPQGLLEKVADSLSSRAAGPSQATSLLSLLNATKS